MFRPLFKKYGCLGPIAASIFLTPFLALAQGLTVELPKPVAAMATQQPLVSSRIMRTASMRSPIRWAGR
jgi:hypothetical protein